MEYILGRRLQKEEVFHIKNGFISAWSGSKEILKDIWQLTFRSGGELEDGGRVGPALLVTCLDYHLVRTDEPSTLYLQVFFFFNFSFCISRSPHSQSQAQVQRRWNVPCTWDLMGSKNRYQVQGFKNSIINPQLYYTRTKYNRCMQIFVSSEDFFGKYQEVPPQKDLLGGPSWGGTSWVHQSSESPTSIIMYYMHCFCSPG